MTRHQPLLISLLLVALFAFACGDDDEAATMAEKDCDYDTDCGTIEEDDYSDCVRNAEESYRDFEETSAACWDAARDLHSCNLDKSCGTELLDACSSEVDRLINHCGDD